MFVRKIHKVLAFALMALLITAKLAAYHSIAHEDDCVECCSFCENVIVIGQTPALATETDFYDDPEYPLPTEEGCTLGATIAFYPQPLASSLFCRPPPAV